MCFPWGWEGTQGAWRCNGIQCRLQKFRYSCNSLSQRHGPPESHISSQLSPPHKTEGEELEGRTGNSCLSWASPDIPVTLPSNQNELDPKALVLTGSESHPCHLFFFFLHTLLSGNALPSNLLSYSKQPCTQLYACTWRHQDNIWVSLMALLALMDLLLRRGPRMCVSQSGISGNLCDHFSPSRDKRRTRFCLMVGG